VPEYFKIYHMKKNYQVNYCYKYIIFLKWLYIMRDIYVK